MSFFGRITEPWPLTVLAYLGTVIVLAVIALVVAAALPDRPERYGWVRRIRDRITAADEEAAS